MLQVTDVCIISADKSDNNWEIEGEVFFDEDLDTAFTATYINEEDEFENLSLELELDITDYDEQILKNKILQALCEYEES